MSSICIICIIFSLPFCAQVVPWWGKPWRAPWEKVSCCWVMQILNSFGIHRQPEFPFLWLLDLVSKVVILIQFSISCLFSLKKIIEACIVIYNWKKKPHYAFLAGFGCCIWSCAAGLVALWFPEPMRVSGSREGVIQAGRWCTRSCAGNLWRKKGARVTQPTKASPRLPICGSGGFHKVFLEKSEADGSKGISWITLPPPRLDGFTTCLMGGVLAASWGFLLRPLLLPQTLEGAVIVACSQGCQWKMCNKERTVDFSGFISPERQPRSWERKGNPAGSIEGCTEP